MKNKYHVMITVDLFYDAHNYHEVDKQIKVDPFYNNLNTTGYINNKNIKVIKRVIKGDTI